MAHIDASARRSAVRFVLLVGVLSLFADFAYEGARSIVGPYMAFLGAGAVAVAVVSGFGELLGYGLRLVSGRVSDATQRFWPVTILGYVIQMTAVPLLALAGSWPVAALLIVLERIGKATRNPPRDAMLAHAAGDIGYGTAFGIHEALDQTGALLGPLAVAGSLALHEGGYRTAFATLAVPAAITLSVLAVARLVYPRPEEPSARPADVDARGLSSAFWLYLCGAALVGAGFADFPLIAFHFDREGTVSMAWIPILYAIAMATGGAGSLVLGRLFDRTGMGILVPLTAVSALFAPLVFLGGSWAALVGASLWGLGMGVHESIIPAAVAPMVAPSRRASAYGLFTAVYGVAWFAGSAVLGVLYSVHVGAAVAFALVAEVLGAATVPPCPPISTPSRRRGAAATSAARPIRWRPASVLARRSASGSTPPGPLIPSWRSASASSPYSDLPGRSAACATARRAGPRQPPAAPPAGLSAAPSVPWAPGGTDGRRERSRPRALGGGSGHHHLRRLVDKL